MKRSSFAHTAGMSLVETMIYAALSMVIAMVAYNALLSTSTLSVKNTNLNRSHDDIRGSYDRLARHLLAASNVPTLINSTGATVTSTYTSAEGYPTTGPAAGFTFDRTIGGPYILDPDTTAGSLPSTASSWNFWVSTDSLATAPMPSAGEILVIPTPTGAIRARVQSASVSGNATGRRRLTVIFTEAVGRNLTWRAGEPQAARLVRREAFLVVGSELRYYGAFQPLPDLTNPANYRVLTDQVSTLSGEQTPFSVEEVNGDRLLSSTLQVRERSESRWLSSEEANSYNTYFQLHVNLPSRLRPATTN